MMRRLGQASQMSRLRLAAENRRTAVLRTQDNVTSPPPRHALARGVWVDYDAQSDIDIGIGPGAGDEGLRLQLRDRGDSPWLTFSYTVGAGTVRAARFLGLVVSGSSKGPGMLRPCLRHYFPTGEGFYDQFPGDAILLDDTRREHFCAFRPDDGARARARNFEVLFFLEGHAFDITLFGVETLQI